MSVQMQQPLSAEQHTFARTFTLHLLPGLAITMGFVAIASLTTQQGWPASLALLVTWLIVGLPLELGYLLYQGRKRNGQLSLKGIVLYRQPIPRRQYLWLVPILLVWSATISTLLLPLEEQLRQTLFPEWPAWLVLSNFAQNLPQYPRSVLWAVVLLSAVLNIVIPIIEELYFRGYLLPRIARWGRWAPFVNVLLFSLYHIWLPWQNLSRIIALLPIVYVVQWKRNIYISILTHCLLNSVGTLGLLALVISQR